MARRSKSSAGSSTSPNKVLVVFLVMFILATIGEGVWAYTMLKEKDTWDKIAKDKTDSETNARREQEWAKYKADETLAAVGDESFLSNSQAVKNWLETRQRFMEDKQFVNQPDHDSFKKTVTGLVSLLGFNDTRGYERKLPELPAEPTKLLAQQNTKYTSKVSELEEKIANFKSLESQVARDRVALLEEINKGQKRSLEERKSQFNATTKAFEELKKMEEKLDEVILESRKKLVEKDKEIKVLTARVKENEETNKNPNRALVEPHALILSASKGKVLWDTPRAKVVRVDDTGKKIYIDKGSKDGVKIGMTFLVFAAGWNNRGEGALKATVDVTRVDSETSQCKIVTFYDIDGREIAANEATPNKLLREGAGALKEGDLCFNLMWGMHVAIVGIVDFSNTNSNSPAAQKDSLDDFMQYMSRLGIVVDAYMDPRDGKMVGEPTSKTNFVIRGASAGDSNKNPRNEMINASIKYMREQAIDRGMFIISPDNFAIVTGYRKTNGADSVQTLSFVPRAPAAGSGPASTDEQDQMPKDGKKMP